jgi:hypothetical protein
MAKKATVCLVLDETGSMTTIRDQTISGYNEYKNGLKNVLFTLVKFNSSKVEMVHDGTPIKDVPDLTRETYTPSDLTPLYDAVGKTITGLKGKKGILVILTDGQENASVEYSQKQIFDMVTEMKEQGWQVVFLGADQDAWAASQVMGIDRGNTMSFVKGKTMQTFRALASATKKSLNGESTDFWEDTDEEDLG